MVGWFDLHNIVVDLISNLAGGANCADLDGRAGFDQPREAWGEVSRWLDLAAR